MKIKNNLPNGASIGDFKRLALKTKEFFGKVILTSVRRPFLYCFLIFLLTLIFGALVFYKYVFLVKKTNPEVLMPQFSLDEKIHQEILKIWLEQEKRFNEADLKAYKDPFEGQVPAVEEPKK